MSVEPWRLFAHFHFGMDLADITLKDRLMLLLGRRRLLKVDGDSMLPTLKSGDVVLIDPAANAAIGDIVVADHPYRQNVILIKRVENIDDRGRYILKGDNPGSSTDSRTYGSISQRDIMGKVICRYRY